jgi:hypothetical protein
MQKLLLQDTQRFFIHLSFINKVPKLAQIATEILLLFSFKKEKIEVNSWKKLQKNDRNRKKIFSHFRRF